MKRTILIGILVLGLFLFLTPQAVAENKVVVISLLGDCSECPPAGPPAPVEKTGQTTWYLVGDDGNFQKGVSWPNPRFFDDGNGTVPGLAGGLKEIHSLAFSPRITGPVLIIGMITTTPGAWT